MMQKQAVYKRKIKGVFSLIIFSLLLFLGVFAICFVMWGILKNGTHVQSPLAHIVSGKNTNTRVVELQDLCVKNHINCSSIVVNSDMTATIIIDTDELVIFSLQKNLSEQFASLQLTIAHLTIEGKRFHRLDFRFDKPVISF